MDQLLEGSRCPRCQTRYWLYQQEDPVREGLEEEGLENQDLDQWEGILEAEDNRKIIIISQYPPHRRLYLRQPALNRQQS
jgi:hypothetical protein